MNTKHIHGAPGKSWCGKDLVMAWVFQDLAHAEGAIAQGSLIKPCKRCLSKARRHIPIQEWTNVGGETEVMVSGAIEATGISRGV